MLANGATLEVKKSGESTFAKLPGLKELPDVGVEPEKVENTTLEDEIKQYENGIGDPGDMTYKFKWDNGDAKASYRILREYEKTGETVSFKETLKDGTTTEFDAQVAVKRAGAGVNAAMEFGLNLSLQSNLKITDPA